MIPTQKQKIMFICKNTKCPYAINHHGKPYIQPMTNEELDMEAWHELVEKGAYRCPFCHQKMSFHKGIINEVQEK